MDVVMRKFVLDLSDVNDICGAIIPHLAIVIELRGSRCIKDL